MNRVSKNKNSHQIEPRIMDVLCALASAPMEVVSRDDLIAKVWKVEFGADESLTRAISLLRKTFKAAGEQDEIIQTIPKRGYRLRKPIKIIEKATPPIEKIKPPVPLNEPEAAKPEPKTSNLQKPRLPTRLLAGLTAFALVALAAVTYWPGQTNEFGQQIKVSEFGRSIAVMPFKDMSDTGDQQHFGDGMSEELTSALTQFPNLRVVGRSRSATYRENNTDILEAGSALRVSHILDGSVRKQGDLVRVTTQLINVADGAQIWSKSYDGTLKNAFALQDQITQDIVTELTLLLGISFIPTIDVEL